MSAFQRVWRFLSKRFARKRVPPVIDNRRHSKNDLECYVTNLDDEEHVFYVPCDSKAETFISSFYNFIGLNDEQDYFGFKNADDVWIDPAHKLRKQMPKASKHKLYLRVKFFSSNPQFILHDEYARYLFTLQLRQDMILGRLECRDLRLVAELAALLLESWEPYDPSQHTLAFVSSHEFLPKELSSEKFYQMVLAEWRRLQGKNLTAEQTDKLYLEKISQMPNYAIEWHPVKGTTNGTENTDYMLGLTPSGILIKEASETIGEMDFRNIQEIVMKRDRLKISIEALDDQGARVELLKFVFKVENASKCKQLWLACCEYHMFFQRERNEAASRRANPGGNVFKLRSRFCASFRTEYQIAISRGQSYGSSSFRRHPSLSKAPSLNKMPLGARGFAPVTRSNSTFRRTPSRRFSRVAATSPYDKNNNSSNNNNNNNSMRYSGSPPVFPDQAGSLHKAQILVSKPPPAAPKPHAPLRRSYQQQQQQALHERSNISPLSRYPNNNI